jgi:hypothetical protein
MSDELKKHISDVNIWKRALFMLLFAILYGLTEVVIWAVVIFQFLIVLFTGSKNERLLEFGQKLTTYIYQIVLFQTFNTETHPFPFGDWPDGPPAENPVEPVAAPPAEPEPVDTASDDEADDNTESDAPIELEQDAPDETDEDTGSDEKPDNKD